MEYHNYNTPLDRIDEDFVKRILAGNFETSSDCERECESTEQQNTGCGCERRTDATKTCRYNGRYSSRNRGCPVVDSGSKSHNRSNGHSCERSAVRSGGCNRIDTRREERPSGNDSCGNGTHKTLCGCGDCVDFTLPTLHGVPHSMVYSPHQDFEGLYECDEALVRGTIFRCLDFPFVPTRCNNRRCNEENKGCR